MENANLEYFQKLNTNFTTLYVEDNHELRKQTIKMLKSFLPNVIEAKSGKEGLALYTQHNNSDEYNNIDLVITDIQMSQKNGLEMISDIRKLDDKTPIVIFSAYDKSDYFLEAIKLGVGGYILKPYTLLQVANVLIDTINKYYKQNVVKLENNYTWYISEYILKQNDIVIKLSKNEIKLIKFLMSQNQGIKSSESIENYIFDDFISNNKRVRGLISRFNTKLNINMIESIYGEGYRIKVLKH